MRICPHCGYQDPWYWRPRPWDPDDDYCYLTDFVNLEPSLCLLLMGGEKVVEDDFYTYRLSGRGKAFVTRRPTVVFKQYGWRTPTEKSKRSVGRLTNQQELAVSF